ncbi:MAG: TolC family protein [Bacteroidota bacterium]
MKIRSLIVSLCICSISWSQEGNRITISSLEEAISLATDRNLTLTMNELQLERARMELKLAQSAAKPQVSGSFTGQKNLELPTTFVPGELFGQPGETVAAQFGQEYQYTAGVTVNKSLIDLSNRLSIKERNKDIDIVASDNAIYREYLIGHISYSYHSLLLAEEAKHLAQEDIQVADSVFQITQSKFDEGLLDLGALNRSKVNFNRVKQDLNEAILVYEDSQKTLKEALGIAHHKTLSLSEKLRLNGFEVPTTESLGANLEILKSEQQTEKAALGLKQARSEYYPKISLTSYFGSQLFQDEFDFSLSHENWSPVQYASLSVSVPIFNGFSTRRKVKIAKLDAEFSELNFKQEKDRLEAEDALLLKNQNLTASMALTSLENYQLHKEIVALEFSKYTEGLVGLEIYLNAFEDYLNAKSVYLNALTTYYQYSAKVYSRS